MGAIGDLLIDHPVRSALIGLAFALAAIVLP